VPFPFLLERFAPSHSLWKVQPRAGERTIYLTYDDGPNPAATPALLDVLEREAAHATFFLIDKHVTEATAPIVQRMFTEGHGVALHADTRALMIKTPDGLAGLLKRNADRIERLAGQRPCALFRPHAGWRSASMYEGLMQIDHRLVGWSWGLWDWNWYRPRDAAQLARRLVSRASPGDIIVMHDGHHVEATPDRQYTIDATARLVPELRRRGFAFGTLCGVGNGASGDNGSTSRRNEETETSGYLRLLRSSV
jgi:peptidoglycan/xylan/chitin deacetylase (PgdA/CDA1 family)